MHSEIERHVRLIDPYEKESAKFTPVAHQRMHRMSRRFLQGVLEVHEEAVEARAALKKKHEADAETIRQLRKALQDLEAANNKLAATRSPEAYDAMLKAGQSDDLIELDRVRLNARNLLRETDPARQLATASP
jgi:Mn-dependent DtxR family transcriptional regulator